jgi:hypothetical protein
MKANRDRPVGIQIQNEVVHAGLTKRYADAALMALDGDIK